MNFRAGNTKPTRPPPPKGKGAISLGGISFKQLEEDEEEEEDLAVYTGKYDRILSEIQKSNKYFREGRLSTSSNSSTSSVAEEIKQFEKDKVETVETIHGNDSDSSLKQSSLTMESSHSPLRRTAKAKLESSKELFSGLKGKITDKISKTIEEFSNDSNSSQSPENEKLKESPIQIPTDREVPFQRSNSFDPVVKEPVTVLSAAPVSESKHPLALGNDSENEDNEFDSLLTATEKSNDVDEDSPTFFDPKEKEDNSDDILVLEEHFENEPSEDFTGVPALTTTTKLKPHSKIKQMIPNKSSKTYAVASLSSLTESLQPDTFEDFTDAATSTADPKSVTKKENWGEISDNIKVKSVDKIDDIIKTMKSVEKSDYIKKEKSVEKSDYFKKERSVEMNDNNLKREKSVAKSDGIKKKSLGKSDDTTKKEKSVEKNDNSQVLSSSKSTDNSAINPEVPKAPQSKSITVLRMLSTDYGGIHLSKVFAVVVAIFAYLIIPLPSYISGFVVGIALASVGWAAYIWIMKPLHPEEPLVLPPVEDNPPPVPEMKQTIPSKDIMYRGWMNESTDYSVDDYHINKTHSIYVSLEGTHLRIQRPKNPAPKRAMWDEVLTKPQFIHQRHFDLVGSKVFLSPSGLVKKRIWSKKYPICLSFKKAITGSEGKDTCTLKHTSSEPLLEAKQKERVSDMGFEILTEDSCNCHLLYLFARTGREKEEWFKRLSSAATGKPLGNHIVEMKQVVKDSVASWYGGRTDGTKKLQRANSTDSLGSTSSQADDSTQPEVSDLLSFSQYMGRLMPSSSSTPSSRASSPSHSTASNRDVPILKSQNSQDGREEAGKVLMRNTPIICDSQLFWLNALIGRCFFDFLRDKWWIGKVTEKLQKKLSKIHVPYFIEELQVSSIEMGYEIPAIRHAGKPYMDERGFWVDLDITYTGGFKMTIETKMNLMRLKKSHHHSSHSVDHSVDQTKSPITDSEEEDSAESSTDEEEEIVAEDNNAASGGGTSKKFMRYLNKITQSRYFQQATEYKVVRRAMENVSNTPLTLTVTVNSLIGKLAVNIPPPPSDRIWYGFRGNPRLRLSAKPQVGERAVTFTHITDWIEKKLTVEFQRVFVMPNMDDLVVPILVPGEVNGTAMTHSMSL